MRRCLPLNEFLQKGPALVGRDARVDGDVLHDAEVGAHRVRHPRQICQLRD